MVCPQALLLNPTPEKRRNGYPYQHNNPTTSFPSSLVCFLAYRRAVSNATKPVLSE